ncbi:hypothetical protein HH310_35145 [Actinoplanes sp. TBRC 11911]|uniref:hypothetical protein n=1 Tax=Actinoplanes sp. TBRC 11911 TaxID=2729386 RepID=UPI00145CCA92|nr:hypothetical protein [Actinoplanes sp. TBRC 11911]NMO56401.1 hypothetical protein [Actinoplanes sp. TBRC 11911]
MNPRIARRTLLLAALGSVTAACTRDGGEDVPAVLDPLPAAPAERTSPAPTAIRSIAYWTAMFDRSWDYQIRTGRPASLSKDSWEFYELSYSLDALTAMFRATGTRKYLDLGLEFLENVAGSAVTSRSLPRSQFNDGYQGWPSNENGENGDEIPLYESYFWRYGTQLLVAMRENPQVYGNKTYRMRYDRLLAFAESQVFAKWYARGPQDWIYRERTHMAAHWALISMNLSRLTADPGKRSRYLTVVANIDLHMPGAPKGLKGQLRRNPVEATAYFWSDQWGSFKRPGQDAGHGNGVMAYVTEARAHGTTWTTADMAAFSATLLKVIWPGGTTYHEFVDGSGEDNGWFSDGFVKLGRFDTAVQARLDSHRVVNDQFAANMALNARILRP